VIASGHYTEVELLSLGVQADAGFDRDHFAGALAAIDRFPDTDFERYGVDADRVAQVRDLMRDWSRALLESNSTVPRRGSPGPRRSQGTPIRTRC
jgi:hypothetical protein